MVLSNILLLMILLFNHGEPLNFDKFNMTCIEPQFKRISKNTLKHCTKQFNYNYKGRLIEMFRTIEFRISLTCDSSTCVFLSSTIYLCYYSLG